METPKKVGDWIHVQHVPQAGEELKLHKIKSIPGVFEINQLATSEEVAEYLKTNID